MPRTGFASAAHDLIATLRLQGVARDQIKVTTRSAGSGSALNEA
jgi:hypothetical protein